jgi:hypothetical protein
MGDRWKDAIDDATSPAGAFGARLAQRPAA